VDTLNNPKLWDERKRKTENDKAVYERMQAKKARLTAADYIVSSNKSARGRCRSQSTTTTTTTTTSDRAVDLDEHKDKDDVIDLVDSRPPSPLLLPNSTIRAALA
jgi:hypothetical protein